MRRIPTAAIGAAAIVAMSTSLAFAGTTGNGASQSNAATPAPAAQWIKASFDKGYQSRSGYGHGYASGRFIIELHLASVSTYAYDPASGTINPIPQQSVEGAPVKGLTVKGGKNPGGNVAGRVIGDFDGDGVATFESNLPAGNYDIVITVPPHAINTKGAGANNRSMAGGKSGGSKPATLTFHAIVTSTCASTKEPKATPKPKAWLCSNFRVDPSKPPTVVVGSGASNSQ